GWDFEPGLVDLILRDIGAGSDDTAQPGSSVEPGALPLLSHALLETWQRRQGCSLTLAGYAASGGVHGAIAHTAENTYAQLSPDQQAIARAVFLRLTGLGEDAGEFTPADTRRRIAPSELAISGEDPTEVQRVVEILAEARLLTAGEGTIEVAHEALIREWPTLRRWLAEDREGLRLHRRLTEAALGWQTLDREPGELLRGVRLAQALEWRSAHPGQLNAVETAFLEASQAEAVRDASERDAQHSRELESARQLAEVNTRRAREQEQTSRRLRWLAGGLGVFLIIAVILGAFFLQQRSLADAASRLAASRELAASSVANLAVDPERSTLLALQAVSVQDTNQAEDALHESVQSLRVVRTFPLPGIWGYAAVFSPDGRLAAASSGGPDKPLSTEIWEAASGKHLLSLPGTLSNNSFLPGGRLATVDTGPGESVLVRFWNPDTGALLATTRLPHSFQDKYGDIDPTGKRIVEVMADGTTIVSDLSTGKVAYTLGVPGVSQAATGAAFSPDGSRLVTTVGSISRLADAATGKPLADLPSGDLSTGTAAFSPDGTRVALGIGPLVKIVDAATGKELLALS
ncbi:MAG TPA: hypothetical protein VF813_11795, partial [Anaerolineaceae bacterium]